MKVKFVPDTNSKFSQFLRSNIKCFHPNKKDFHQNFFYLLTFFALIIVKNAKVGCVRWFHGRYHSKLYLNFAKKRVELSYLYRNFLFKKCCYESSHLTTCAPSWIFRKL